MDIEIERAPKSLYECYGARVGIAVLVAGLVNQIGPRRQVASVRYTIPRTFPMTLGWLANR